MAYFQSLDYAGDVLSSDIWILALILIGQVYFKLTEKLERKLKMLRAENITSSGIKKIKGGFLFIIVKFIRGTGCLAYPV